MTDAVDTKALDRAVSHLATAMPLYIQIAEVLLDRIESGEPVRAAAEAIGVGGSTA